MRRLDLVLVEYGGSGGIYEHARFLAESMGRAGLSVEFHTSDDAKEVAGVRRVAAFGWYRSVNRFRAPRIAVGFLLLTLPKLMQSARHASLVHVHGLMRLPMTVLILALARICGATVIFSPHNTFVRAGSSLDDQLLRVCYRLADTVVVYARSDLQRVQPFAKTVVHVGLVMPVMRAPDAVVRYWRDRLGPSPIVTSPGYIRDDKDPLLFVEAFSECERINATIIGADHGAAVKAQKSSNERGGRVKVLVTDLSDVDFAAVLQASDLVVCAYREASQSAIVRLCATLGVPTLVSRAGGLAEYATYVSACASPSELCRDATVALQQARRPPSLRPPSGDEFKMLYCSLLSARRS